MQSVSVFARNRPLDFYLYVIMIPYIVWSCLFSVREWLEKAKEEFEEKWRNPQPVSFIFLSTFIFMMGQKFVYFFNFFFQLSV